ncbi:MAG TPA: hypothetical protein VGO07_02025 [Candidatus Saccharimonadales bacterium]|jgi:hypothetical protein|nr:hypothetical protein [Candidatus Saccharimonadales bacterium]
MAALDSYGSEALSELYVPHFEVDEVLAVDWDGTMGIVSENVELLKGEAARYGVSPAQIEASKAEAKAHDGFFDPLSDVESLLGDDQFTEFGDRFIGDGRGRATLYDDAGDLLVWAEKVTAPTVGLTHGKNPLWQFVKVRRGLEEARQKNGANGYLYTEVMTGPKEKGPHIGDWRAPNGTFPVAGLDENGQTIAVIHGGSVELLDDRSYSHEGLPPAPHATGALVKRASAPESRRLEGIPEHLRDRVRIVWGLGDISVSPIKVPASRRRTIALPSGIVAFKPLYAPGKYKPGLLITPQTSFSDLRAASRRQLAHR